MAKNQKKSNVKSSKLVKVNDKTVDTSVSFYCCDGSRFYSLTDLVNALNEMNEGVFIYHVSESKNDFHNWIKDVFKEDKLALAVLKAKSAKDLKKIIKKYL